MSDLRVEIQHRIFTRVSALRPGQLIDPGDVLCSWGIGDIQEMRPDLRIDWDRDAHGFRVTLRDGKN